MKPTPDAMQNARLVKNAELYYRMMFLSEESTFLVGLVNGTVCLILSTLLAIYFSLSPRLWERGQGRRWL